MKATGIVRNMDMLGRVVIPSELRRLYGIDTDTAMEFYSDKDGIILRKCRPCCELCGSMDEGYRVGGHRICRICAEDISHAFTGKRAEA